MKFKGGHWGKVICSHNDFDACNDSHTKIFRKLSDFDSFYGAMDDHVASIEGPGGKQNKSEDGIIRMRAYLRTRYVI